MPKTVETSESRINRTSKKAMAAVVKGLKNPDQGGANDVVRRVRNIRGEEGADVARTVQRVAWAQDKAKPASQRKYLGPNGKAK